MSKYERSNIRAMQGYAWGEQPENDNITKLNTNENPYPSSPAVQTAFNDISIDKLRTYPQPTADALRDAISARHNLARDNVVVTQGGDEALRLAMTTFVNPGAGFGMTAPSYTLYPVLAGIHDATVTAVPFDDGWTLPKDFALQLNRAAVELTCVVNPHAPSGVLTTTDTLSQVAANLDGVLLIDEAYADFIDPALEYDSTSLVADHDNVLILRSFSKGYSLAGLRLGYLLGSVDLIDPIMSKTRDSYNVDHVSQTLGLAAFNDLDYASTIWQKVRVERQRLQASLAQLGLLSPPSQSNFLLVEVPDGEETSALKLYEQLKQQGILVRFFDTPDLHTKLRITVGTPAENDILIAALTSALT